VVGFWLSRWGQRATAQEKSAMLNELMQHAASGILKTEIEKSYRLAEVDAALEHARQNRRSGKILFAA
jgi:NADPH:quinone reductase-like Zn-dependent oxidoreductase